MTRSINDKATHLVAAREKGAGLKEVRRAAQALELPLLGILEPVQTLLQRMPPDDAQYADLAAIAGNCDVLRKQVDDLKIALRAATKARVGFKQTGRILARNLSDLMETTRELNARHAGGGAERYRILVVDDAPDTRFLVSAVLGPFADVESVGSGAEALTLLRGETSFDVVVSDVMMPGTGGDELARVIRADPTLMDIGIILLSGRSDPAFRAAVIHETVDDYLVKPFDTNELTARALRLARDARARANLRRRALTDALTALPNRAALVEQMEHHVRLRTQDLSVVIFDIDHFKQVNDSWGHVVGDQVLGEFADILGRQADAPRLAARFGGEEFVLVLPNTPSRGALAVAEALVAEVATHPMTTTAGTLQITASAGVATLNDSDVDWSGLLARADLRLYQAKDAGRNRVCASGHA